MRRLLNKIKGALAAHSSGVGKAPTMLDPLSHPDIPDGYEMVYTTLEDIRDDDMVLGSDGKWHHQQPLDIQTPEKAFRIVFSNGCEVTCSGDHEWNVWWVNDPHALEGEDPWCETLATEELFELLPTLNLNGDHPIGAVHGPTVRSIEPVNPEPMRCLAVDSEDHQFVVGNLANHKHVLTHNCQFRAVCGRLQTTASIMAAGSAVCTGIADVKGRGMTISNGKTSNVQYYFENPSWLTNWFHDRGMDDKGWAPEDLETPGDQQEESLEGVEDISIKGETVHIDFNGEHAEVDRTQEQHFEEV